MRKGKKICRIYPKVRVKTILFVILVFIAIPFPLIAVSYFFGAIDSFVKILSHVFLMELIFIVSGPFILFIYLYIGSIAIYKNGLLSHNPANNRPIFMPWESMEDIKHEMISGKDYYKITSADCREAIWLPLSTIKRKAFVETARSCSGKFDGLLDKI